MCHHFVFSSSHTIDRTIKQGSQERWCIFAPNFFRKVLLRAETVLYNPHAAKIFGLFFNRYTPEGFSCASRRPPYGGIQYSPKIIHAQEVVPEMKMLSFCDLPTRTFETQEAENLAARSRKKLRTLPQTARSRKKYRCLCNYQM